MNFKRVHCKREKKRKAGIVQAIDKTRNGDEDTLIRQGRSRRPKDTIRRCKADECHYQTMNASCHSVRLSD